MNGVFELVKWIFFWLARTAGWTGIWFATAGCIALWSWIFFELLTLKEALGYASIALLALVYDLGRASLFIKRASQSNPRKTDPPEGDKWYPRP
jgi:hypothetical protein